MRKLALIFGLLASIVTVTPAFATTVNTGPLAISKTVLNPKANTYVSSLGLNDPMYHPGDTVTFHITVANLSKSAIDQAVVKDTFPSYITFSSGPGEYNPTDKTLSFFVYNVQPGTTQAFSVSAIINNVTALPSDQTITCMANKADVSTNTLGNSQDQASFCIQKTYQSTNTITRSPDTGVESIAYYGLGVSSLFGFALRNLAKNPFKRG